MSEFNLDQFTFDDQYQSLDQVDLHSPEFPVEGYENLPNPSTFDFGDFLSNTDVEMIDTQASQGMTSISQGNNTRVELPVPLITDNATVNPSFLNKRFTSNMNPLPTVGFTAPAVSFTVPSMPPIQKFPAPFEFSNDYRHTILNAFPSPSYPLHIIDSFGSLPGSVMEALQQGLKRCREVDDELNQFVVDGIDIIEPFNPNQSPAKKRVVSKGKGIAVPVASESVASHWDPEDFAISETEEEFEPKEPEVNVRPTKVPGKSWIKPNMSTQGKNKRSRNIQSLNPSSYYAPLAKQPQSWGNPNRAGVVPFRYTPDGELSPYVKYTASQIKEFIFNHPGHSMGGQRHTKASGLTLWVQSVPSDSAARYAHPNSDKCRFEDCPARNGTILKGQYRVAFDEQSSDPVLTDPFHNAGHVHLYCLEKFLDFRFICANFNVRPDDRILAEGRNKMAITRDHVEMKRVVRIFVRNAEREYANPNFVNLAKDYKYEDTLCYKLTVKHLELEPANRQSVRDRRPNSNSLDKHMNNLDKYVAGKVIQKQARLQPDKKVSSSGSSTSETTDAKSNKRKAAEMDQDNDAEFDIDGSIFDVDGDTIIIDTQEQTQSSSTQGNPAKRTRLVRKRSRKSMEMDNSNSDNESSEDSDASDWEPAKKPLNGPAKRLSRLGK
ncbi:88063374-aff9-4a02-9499-fd8cb071b03b [Sclerotinia trifoliorum]|uniref:88063374-aff9-4a02-9499-fd8cb071b03b n=1 Tax=Sclerotinia trifoliorum TaxID=28548 RepID=A0A8H2VQV1_9HELO|nr:88063374-aff9-4a02-9499-fd8cb071b03b [Sclerotinia trifoliorum]